MFTLLAVVAVVAAVTVAVKKPEWLPIQLADAVAKVKAAVAAAVNFVRGQ